VFYGGRENAPMSQPEIRNAKVMCLGCPVREQCLEEALLNGEDWGIWGGYTKPERARAVEVLGYIDVLSGGELVPADVQTVMDTYRAGELDLLVLL
jgi:hypothetical protein